MCKRERERGREREGGGDGSVYFYGCAYVLIPAYSVFIVFVYTAFSILTIVQLPLNKNLM